MEVRGGLEVIDVLPGLNIDLDVHGLASHDAGDSDEYEEWGVSGGFRYDPRPETAAGPLVSLVHSWNPAGGGGLREALWRNDPARRGPPSLGCQEDTLSAEFARGFNTFGVVSVPWARVGVRARIHPGLGVQPALPHPGGGADDARHRPARRTVRYRVADQVPLDHPASGVLWIAQRVLRRAFTGIGI